MSYVEEYEWIGVFPKWRMLEQESEFENEEETDSAKWVLKFKSEADGSYKVRLILNGFTQFKWFSGQRYLGIVKSKVYSYIYYKIDLKIFIFDIYVNDIFLTARFSLIFTWKFNKDFQNEVFWRNEADIRIWITQDHKSDKIYFVCSALFEQVQQRIELYILVIHQVCIWIPTMH